MFQHIRNNSFKSKSLRFLVVLLLVFGLFAGSGAGSTVPTAQAADSTNQIIVQLLPGRDILGLSSLINSTAVRTLSLDNTYLLSLPLGSPIQLILNLLKVTPGVVFAEPNYKLYSTEAQQAFMYYDSGSAIQGDSAPQAVQTARNQWAWQRIDLVRSQRMSKGANVTVATLDTGVNPNHPALKDKLVSGYNILTADSNVADDNGHGTFVAGVIAQVAPEAKILPVKVLNSKGEGTVADASEGVFWAASHNASVINMSLGLYNNSMLLQLTVNYAQSKGKLVVASAGNSGTAEKRYPASYPGVIGVAATDSANHKAAFSNYGDNAKISAPGVRIYSAYFTGGYAYGDGTSFAAPMVAALAAQVWSTKPNDSVGAVSQEILTNSIPLAWSDPAYGNKMGAGLVNNYLTVVNS